MASLRSLIAVAAFSIAPSIAVAAPSARNPDTSSTPLDTAKNALSAPAHMGRRTSAHRTSSALRAAGMSLGSPSNGKLVGGARLDSDAAWRIYPDDAQGDVRWGLESLVGMIERSARAVRKQFPDAVLSVGHLSKAGGGEIDRHASHESGRDADLGFYVKNTAGKPIYADHMVAFKGDGTSPSWPGAHFDDARNWALVAAMLKDPSAHITHIFVAFPIRERLLAYATKIGAPAAIRTRGAEVLVQPRGALPHDDHFHVRISCPSAMNGCVEQPIAKSSKVRGRAGAQASRQSPAVRSRPKAKSAPSPSERSEREETAKSDSVIPSLAPVVPGLDSVVIPKPLVGAKATWGVGAKEAQSEDVDDPD
ncbi:MAG: penicillin-insensitive murein endopeptidase [Polyangiaceae bacterium]|nr:penicillin-insensitive murein endopeptidase [Polyangiaceae bacterium]